MYACMPQSFQARYTHARVREGVSKKVEAMQSPHKNEKKKQVPTRKGGEKRRRHYVHRAYTQMIKAKKRICVALLVSPQSRRKRGNHCVDSPGAFLVVFSLFL